VELKQKVQAYEDSPKINLEEQERQRRNEELIANLQSELSAVNRQLTTNRKLFSKLRGGGKESSTSVESDIKMATMSDENKFLAGKVQELDKKVTELKGSEEEKVKEIQKLSKQVQELGAAKLVAEPGSISEDAKVLRKVVEEGQLKQKQQE
jgi:hypothetical protein